MGMPRLGQNLDFSCFLRGISGSCIILALSWIRFTIRPLSRSFYFTKNHKKQMHRWFTNSCWDKCHMEGISKFHKEASTDLDWLSSSKFNQQIFTEKLLWEGLGHKTKNTAVKKTAFHEAYLPYRVWSYGVFNKHCLDSNMYFLNIVFLK